jgi:hypothetical protein
MAVIYRQDREKESIQEVCDHCAEMQRLNDQLAQMCDNYRRQVEALLMEPHSPDALRAAA